MKQSLGDLRVAPCVKQTVNVQRYDSRIFERVPQELQISKTEGFESYRWQLTGVMHTFVAIEKSTDYHQYVLCFFGAVFLGNMIKALQQHQSGDKGATIIVRHDTLAV